MNPDTATTAEASTAKRWRPLEAIQRRVLGVLIEKAKTTPENYPLSLNALRGGCNQKSNRSPFMQLEESQVEQALEELREFGAVMQVQGGGRVDRYRHLAYEWLGVEKVELAVMAELLLRGAQTVGELRGRAARMEPIKDLGELMPTLDALVSKGLVVYLTPPGRGSVVSHALYLDREMEKVRRESGALQSTAASPPVHREAASASPAELNAETNGADSAELREQLQSLRDELAALKFELESARSEFTSAADELRRDLDDLRRQLGG
jgi:uncharacterized protein YceH (UPF0502 family)